MIWRLFVAFFRNFYDNLVVIFCHQQMSSLLLYLLTFFLYNKFVVPVQYLRSHLLEIDKSVQHCSNIELYRRCPQHFQYLKIVKSRI